jgi:hypothetical protein
MMRQYFFPMLDTHAAVWIASDPCNTNLRRPASSDACVILRTAFTAKEETKLEHTGHHLSFREGQILSALVIINALDASGQTVPKRKTRADAIAEILDCFGVEGFKSAAHTV